VVLRDQPEEVGNEFSSMIGGDLAWDTVLGEDVEKKELCEMWRCDGVISRDAQ